jgi:ABC-2 type transport system permease protein
MKQVLLLARRELATFFNTWWGWSILALILLLDGILFNAFAVKLSEPRFSNDVLEDFFFFSSGTTMIAGVLLSMRCLAEERQTGTMVLLQTAPITETQVVVGKFLGSFAFLTLITLCTLYLPALIEINGKVSWAHIFTGYLGLLMLGGVALSMGVFGSSLTRHQLVAAMFASVALVICLMGWYISEEVEPPLKATLAYLALYEEHFEAFQQGLLDWRSVVFFLSLMSGFLMMAVQVLKTRRFQ